MAPVNPFDPAAIPEELISEIHEAACKRGEDTYTDPVSGRIVFTKEYHLMRGYCCNSGCRHCPYKASATP